MARGDQRADSDSDIDILVEIEPNAGVDLFAYLDIVHFIEDLFTTRVDVANRRRLKSFVRPGPSAMRSMLSDLARSGLIDIRDNIGLAKVFVASMAFEAFKASPLNFYAVTRALEIISEANRRLRAYHPHLPWRAIRDVGNLCRHSYDDVAEDYAWATVRDHPEPLLAAVVAELAVSGDGVTQLATARREDVLLPLGVKPNIAKEKADRLICNPHGLSSSLCLMPRPISSHRFLPPHPTATWPPTTEQARSAPQPPHLRSINGGFWRFRKIFGVENTWRSGSGLTPGATTVFPRSGCRCR